MTVQVHAAPCVERVTVSVTDASMYKLYGSKNFPSVAFPFD